MVSLTKQPNGKFALYCTEKADLVLYNADEEELVEYLANEYKVHLRKNIHKAVNRMSKSTKEGCRGCGGGASEMRWERVMRLIRKTKGQKRVDSLLKEIEETHNRIL